MLGFHLRCQDVDGFHHTTVPKGHAQEECTIPTHDRGCRVLSRHGATAMLGGSAMAAPPHQQSTPVDFPASDGELMSYVVNAKAGNAKKTRDAVQAVTAAGGGGNTGRN